MFKCCRTEPIIFVQLIFHNRDYIILIIFPVTSQVLSSYANSLCNNIMGSVSQREKIIVRTISHRDSHRIVQMKLFLLSALQGPETVALHIHFKYVVVNVCVMSAPLNNNFNITFASLVSRTSWWAPGA